MGLALLKDCRYTMPRNEKDFAYIHLVVLNDDGTEEHSSWGGFRPAIWDNPGVTKFDWDWRYFNHILDWTAGKELFEAMIRNTRQSSPSEIRNIKILFKKMMKSLRVTILFNGKCVVSSGSYKESIFPGVYKYLHPRASESHIASIGSERSLYKARKRTYSALQFTYQNET